MRRLSRRFFGVLLVTALALTLGWRPGDAAEAPPEDDGPSSVEVHGPTLEAFEARMHAKRAITRDVVAGRRSLVEAAALFGALNRRPPAMTEPPAEACQNRSIPIPARTAEERLCWQVACWVFGEQPGVRHRRTPAAVARLAAEFDRELRAHGAIRLPDPATLEPVEGILQRAAAEANEQRAVAAQEQGEGGPLVDAAGSRAD